MAQKPAGQKTKVRLPLIGAYSNRGTNPHKDQRFVNAFPETRKVEQLDNTRIYINKRPGLVELANVTTDAQGRGFIHFYSHFYSIIGNTIWQTTESGATSVALITLPSSVGPCGIIQANSSTLGDYLFIVDGTVGWVIEASGTATQITDADFPTPHSPVPTFLDGYVFVAKGSDVYNCDLDDPFGWTTDQYLSAEQFPDPVVGLARQNNQIVVFGQSSIEFFYDAANASGSPLSRNDAAIIQMGIAAPHAVYQNEQFCAYVGQSESGGRAVWVIEGFKPRKVSDEYIERILDAEGRMKDCVGFGFRTKGHLFFLINLKQQDRTLVYDFDEKLWHEWATTIFVPTTYNPQSSSPVDHHAFNYDHSADNQTGKIYLLSASTGDIYYLSPDENTDEGNPIVVEIRTNKYDMDTINRKFGASARIVGDAYEYPNTIYLSWSDDDYQTWSNQHPMDLSDGHPYKGRMGHWRRRAWRLIHVQNAPLRLESLELYYEEGIS